MLEVFKNNQFLIRVAKDEFNEPLFCLNDVCKSLELTNTNHAKRSIEREWQGVTLNVTPFRTEGGVQNFTMISEPQLYFLIMRSDKPNAKAFRMWVNCEVLPAIRKQGHYNKISNTRSLTIPQWENKREQNQKEQVLKSENESLKDELINTQKELIRLYQMGGGKIDKKLNKLNADTIKEIRKLYYEKGFTQKEVARLLGIGTTSVYKYTRINEHGVFNE